MAANVPIPETAGALERGCADESCCRRLRALARIEEIAGFAHAARAYVAQAARCRSAGCCAAQSGSLGERAFSATMVPFGIHQHARPSPGSSQSRAADVIPFDRAASVDIVSDQAGNYVERRPLKLETLSDRGDPLGYLYAYWSGLRAASACRFTNIDTVHLDRAGIIGKMHVVDVSSSDPGDFRFELFGYAVPVGHYETPRAHPIGIWTDSLLRDYNTVRISGIPRLHRMRARLNKTNFHYTRLILPFLNTESRVNRLAVMIRQEPGDGLAA
jgi:hypothetical protein